MKYIVSSLLVAVLFFGCKKQQIPAYLTINQFELNQNPSVANSIEGKLTQNITNVLVYINGNNIGYYQLPVRIPILAEGVTNVQLFPAVQQNGIAGTIIDYPFYQSWDTTINFVPEGEFDVIPKTMYKNNIGTWIMDFEGASSLDDQPNSLVPMTKIDANHPTAGHHIESDITDSGIGYVRIDQVDSLWNARTNSTVNPSGKVWIELDYKITNSVLNTFLAGQSGGGIDEFPYLFLTPSDSAAAQWKKIYIDITENVSYAASANYYEAGFTAVLDEGLTEAEICMDNIKIIYFQ